MNTIKFTIRVTAQPSSLRASFTKQSKFWYVFSSLVLIALLVSACQSTVAVTETPTTAPSLTVSPPTPTENVYGFSQDAFVTLTSLEKVNDYPLYVMHFVGGYDSPAMAILPDNTSFACSLFAALGDEDNLLYGRNFDWTSSPALLLYTDPPDGYASVSMVNLAFLGINSDNVRPLREISLPERAPLLQTPHFPSDGMNEYGLAIGMAAVDESVADYDPSRPTIGSLLIIREVLDHARDVDEVVVLFGEYNIDFSGGPPIHYLVADSRGQSVLLEYVDGQMAVLPNENTWHLATNHLLAAGIRTGGNSSWRYDIVGERLATTSGILTPVDAMDLLKVVSSIYPTQTQWSVVYDISNGSIDVAMGRNYDAIDNFQLKRVYP